MPGWRSQVVEWLQEVRVFLLVYRVYCWRVGVVFSAETALVLSLLQLALVFCLDLDTIQTATTIFDRTLSAVPIRSSQLQTCALAALFFTVKILESQPFHAVEIEKYFSKVGTVRDILNAERNMLRILDWDINVFTTVSYVRWLLTFVPDEHLARELQTSAEILSSWTMLGASSALDECFRHASPSTPLPHRVRPAFLSNERARSRVCCGCLRRSWI